MGYVWRSQNQYQKLRNRKSIAWLIDTWTKVSILLSELNSTLDLYREKDIEDEIHKSNRK